MKSFDLQQLRLDCLNPKHIDGTPLKHDGAEIQFSRLEELDEYITTLTTKMCEKRRQNVELIESDYKEVQRDIPILIENISKIKEHVNFFLKSKDVSKNLTNDKCNRIIECCESIIKKAEEYKLNIETMYERFSRGTIRISAIGEAGQGKSTFAKYYTGLANGVIPTHKTENEETTGTVCTLIHTDSDEIKHVASYYTRQEILDTLNYYLDEIKEVTGNRDNPDFRLVGGVTKFVDFDRDVVENIGKFRIDDIPYNSRLTTDLRKGIEAFFAKTEEIRGGFWYDFLGKNPCELSSQEEQQRHILMTDRSSLYLAVKEVKTYIRFPKNGEIFTNFEIVDTKGIGSAAGAHAIREVCSAIDSSDAVFSIQAIQTGTGFPFYNHRYLISKYGGDKMFKSKHFMILNPHPGSKCEIALDTLRGMGLAGDYAYCGALYAVDCPRTQCVIKEHDENMDCILSCKKNEQCRDFVDNVVRNMLLRVSTMVYDLDKDRITKRRKDKNTLFESIALLSQELLDVEDYTYKNKEDVLLNKIRGFFKEIQDYVSGMNVKEEENSDKDYVYYLEQGTEITLYDIITSEGGELQKSEKKFVAKTQSEVNDAKVFIKREIKEGLNDSFDTFAKHYKDRAWSEREEVGSFIDDFGDGLSKRIARVLLKLNSQKELEPKVREEISNEIWRILGLNAIFPESQGQWRGELIRTSNKVFEHLDNVFAPTLADAKQPKSLFTPYLLLCKYFNKNVGSIELPNVDEHGFISDNKEYINKERLIDVSTEVLYKLGIHDLVKDIYNSHSENCQRAALKKKLESLVHVKDDAEECLEFYSMYSSYILTEEEQEKIELAISWKTIKELNRQIQDIPFVKNCGDNDN